MKFPEGTHDLFARLLAKFSLNRAANLIDAEPEELLEAIRTAKSPAGYRREGIPKRRGGFRLIDKPAEGLKKIQRKAHKNLLKKNYVPTRICHSFVGKRYDPSKDYGKRWLWGRNIVSAAFAHMGVPADKEPEDPGILWRHPMAMFSIDMKDAYPGITTERVMEIYKKLVGDELTAKFLTDLCVRNGSIPQGAPTSPLLFNLACRELDQALWEEFEAGDLFSFWRVTRYVDDITLTSLDKRIENKQKDRLIKIVSAHGFKINHEKTCYWEERSHVLRVLSINLDPGSRRVYLPRESIMRLRFFLHHSFRVLREENLERLIDIKEDGGKFFARLRKRERRAIGRILGVVGLCYMLYGKDEMPRRIFAGKQLCRGFNPGAILQEIRKGTLTTNPDDVLFGLYNH